MIEWIQNNKEWLFSGIMISVPIAIISFFVTAKKTKQSQKNGSNSTNYQVGGNFTINNTRESAYDSKSKERE